MQPMEYNRATLRINRKTPLVTYILVTLLVIVYGVEMYLNQMYSMTEVYIMMGAKVNYYIAHGEYWRLVSPIFLHAGLEHLLFNAMALYIWGRNIEALLGKVRYILVFFTAGIAGCVASFAFSSALSVGASGAIFGLFGTLLYFRQQHRALFTQFFGIEVLLLIAINLGLGFIREGIDNFGHLGGLIGGFLMSNIVGLYQDRSFHSGKILLSALLVILLIGGIIYGALPYWT